MKLLLVGLFCCIFVTGISGTTDSETRRTIDALITRVENVELENSKLKKEVKLLRDQQRNGRSVYRLVSLSFMTIYCYLLIDLKGQTLIDSTWPARG